MRSLATFRRPACRASLVSLYPLRPDIPVHVQPRHSERWLVCKVQVDEHRTYEPLCWRTAPGCIGSAFVCSANGAPFFPTEHVSLGMYRSSRLVPIATRTCAR